MKEVKIKGKNGGAREGAGMPAGKAVKWPTPEARREACAAFCAHLEAGYSEISWPDADTETIKRYIADFPEDFSLEHVKGAKRKSLKFWEGLGIAGTSGKLKGFNARSWEVNMNNRAGWKSNVDIDVTSDGEKVKSLNVTELTPEEVAAIYRKRIKREE